MGMRLSTGLAIVLLCGATTLAQAAPPTVTPSPGYDRRLQESRSDTSGTLTIMPAPPVNPTAAPPHAKRKRTH